MSFDFNDGKGFKRLVRWLLLDEYDLSLFGILESYGSFDYRRLVIAYTGLGLMAVKMFQAESYQQEADALRFLSARKFAHAPQLYPSATGKDVVTFKGVAAYMMECIEDDLPDPCPPGDWADLGRAAGRLNCITDCPVPFRIPVEEAITEMNAWAEGQPFAAGFRELTPLMLPLAGEKPASMIHGEVCPANAARRTDGSIALLDWDEAGTGPAALELGYPLITHFIEVGSHVVRLEEARAFYGGYFEENPVEVDPEMIYRAGVFHAARYLRFHDVERRWNRLQYALENRQALLDAVFQPGG